MRCLVVVLLVSAWLSGCGSVKPTPTPVVDPQTFHDNPNHYAGKRVRVEGQIEQAPAEAATGAVYTFLVRERLANGGMLEVMVREPDASEPHPKPGDSVVVEGRMKQAFREKLSDGRTVEWPEVIADRVSAVSSPTGATP